MTGRLRFIALLALVLAVASIASAATPEQLIDDGHFKQARAVLEPQLRANPNDANLNWLAARVHRAFGDIAGAITYAQKAVQLAPQKADYRLTLAELEGHQAQQSSLFRQAILARSIHKELETAYQLEPTNLDALWGLLQYYWLAPSIVGGDKSKARAMANVIAKLNAAQGCIAEASLAADEKRFADVERNYRRAIDIDTKNYEARVSLAQFYASDGQKKYGQAEDQFLAAMKLRPTRIDSYAGLAGIYAQREQWQKLDELLMESEREIGDNYQPFYEAARVLSNTGRDLPRAERYLKKYVGQEAEGNAAPIPEAHWRLSQVLEKLGRKPEAIAELNTAVRLNPYFEPAKKDLKRLRG